MNQKELFEEWLDHSKKLQQVGNVIQNELDFTSMSKEEINTLRWKFIDGYCESIYEIGKTYLVIKDLFDKAYYEHNS